MRIFIIFFLLLTFSIEAFACGPPKELSDQETQTLIDKAVFVGDVEITSIIKRDDIKGEDISDVVTFKVLNNYKNELKADQEDLTVKSVGFSSCARYTWGESEKVGDHIKYEVLFLDTKGNVRRSDMNEYYPIRKYLEKKQLEKKDF